MNEIPPAAVKDIIALGNVADSHFMFRQSCGDDEDNYSWKNPWHASSAKNNSSVFFTKRGTRLIAATSVSVKHRNKIWFLRRDGIVVLRFLHG